MHFSFDLFRLRHLMLALFICLCAPAFAQQDVFRLMVIGDDFLAGEKLGKEDTFIFSLQKKLYLGGYNNVLVVNETKPGRTAEYVRENINSFLKQNPHAVILAIGYHDISNESDNALERLSQNLNFIVTSFKKARIPVMLVGMELPETKPIAYRMAFEDIYRGLAKEQRLTFYPFLMKGVFPTFLGIQLSGHVLSDSVNPDEKGVQIILKNMYSTIVRFLQKPV